jgi:hypothetical protein
MGYDIPKTTTHLQLWHLLELNQLLVNHSPEISLVNLIGFWISDGDLKTRSCAQMMHENYVLLKQRILLKKKIDLMGRG